MAIKGSTINDLGGAEEKSKMNLFFSAAMPFEIYLKPVQTPPRWHVAVFYFYLNYALPQLINGRLPSSTVHLETLQDFID